VAAAAVSNVVTLGLLLAAFASLCVLTLPRKVPTD
jgi:hypothetical protein